MQLPLLLDRSRPSSLAAQVAEQLRDAIMQGRIGSGARVPSSRRLADQLGISRNTVVRAYEWLIVEGYVESRPASGMFVAQDIAERKQSLAGPPSGSADGGGPYA